MTRGYGGRYGSAGARGQQYVAKMDFDIW
jgi:hypothetical protein